MVMTLALGGIQERAGAHRFPAGPPIEDPEGRALLSFHQALSRTHARARESEGAAITRIIHYGDSHVAADRLTGALRQDFQRDFGDAGLGFIFAGRPWPWYARSGVEISASAGWQTDGLGPAALPTDGRFGLAGLSFSTEREGEWIRLMAACQRFDLYALKQPEGGAVAVWLDGRPYYDDVALDSEQAEAAYLTIEAEGDRPHEIELRTVAPGRVRIFGWVAEREQAGVSYDALGINGARAGRPLTWDWPVLESQLARRDPDLIIVAYGSNEVSDADLDLAAYRESFSELLHRLRQAAPRASLLVIAPPDRAVRMGKRWRTISAMRALVAAQRQAALASGAAFWDLFRAMGGPGSIARWAALPQPLAQPDRVHLTPAGYRLVAETLYRELMRSYLQFIWRTIWKRWGLG
jgi:lysophospholipase L1-like esterase